MQFTRSIKAEALKQAASPYVRWLLSLAVIIPLIWSGINAYFSGKETDFEVAPDTIPSQVVSVGMIFVLVYAVIAATSEYNRDGDVTLFTSTPKRFWAILAKLLFTSIMSALVLFIATVGAFAMYLIFARGSLDGYVLSDDRALWATPVVLLVSLIAFQGLGWILRSSALAVTVSILWFVVIETAVVLIPKIGQTIYEWMPLNNLSTLVSQQGSAVDNWGVSFMYGAAMCIVLWIIGVVVASKRDC